MDKLRLLYSCLDFTTLEGTDNSLRIASMVKMLQGFAARKTDFPNVAAICVYPSMVADVKKNIGNLPINIASVAGAFPSGQTAVEVKIAEVKYAVESGANEIDTVINRGKLLEGSFEDVERELREIKTACGNAHLKVILETGELPDVNTIRKASEIAISAGADFIKTSTGKISIGATPVAAAAMLSVIKQHYIKTGKKIGFKPSGGISDISQAEEYLEMTKEIAGEEWLTSTLFRIGASRLAMRIQEAAMKE